MSKIERTVIRKKGGRFCALEVTLEDREGVIRLSICGTEGRIYRPAAARREALLYWEQFFEESPEERHAMNDRFGRNFRTAKGAAKFVIDSDGEYHGLDIYQQSDTQVLVSESCGQIREILEGWFPEALPYFAWHLNDLHAECEHQEARGENYDTHPDAKCSDCGWKLGSGWKARKLPDEVILWARGLPGTLGMSREDLLKRA